MATLVAPRLKSCLKQPNTEIKRVASAHCPNECLGRGNRYRLGDASFTLHFQHGEEEADEALHLTPPWESFRHAVNTLADADWLPTSAPPYQYKKSIDPKLGGARYWFGVARGLRNAKLLLTDLRSEFRSNTGWPIYWTSERACIFDDQVGAEYDK